MDFNFTNENDPWEYSLDIDDSDLYLTLVALQLSSTTCFEPSSSTPNSVRIIPGPAGLVQQASQLKETVFILDSDGALMSTQEYMQKVVEDVDEDDDFNSEAWISATNYVIFTGGTITGCLGDINNFLKKGKVDQVFAIVKSSPNYLGDLNMTMKDLSGTVRGTIHYKVLDVGNYGKNITNPKQALGCVENANKENPNNGIVQKVQVLEQFEVSLADELNVMREKINRLRADKEKTEKMLKERGLMMEMKMKELVQRGEVQKELEIEVDRLYRLNELKTLCNRILPIKSLRDKEQEKIKPDRSQFEKAEEKEPVLVGCN
uniref:Uncharacterized protein n=1 Tax=Tanacetum cinerariifolium TaxID=118510 RepID=A0A6L2KJG2_TANCI|nr:hypothetical protein [Tanacetum cinerariifolium]